MADVRIHNRGTIWTFRLLSKAAVEWTEHHVPNIPDYMTYSDGFHADWRPARDIANGMIDDGLDVSIDIPVPGLQVSAANVQDGGD